MSAFSAHASLANTAILAAFGQPVSYQQGISDPFTVLGVLERKGDEETGDSVEEATSSGVGVPPTSGSTSCAASSTIDRSTCWPVSSQWPPTCGWWSPQCG